MVRYRFPSGLDTVYHRSGCRRPDDAGPGPRAAPAALPAGPGRARRGDRARAAVARLAAAAGAGARRALRGEPRDAAPRARRAERGRASSRAAPGGWVVASGGDRRAAERAHELLGDGGLARAHAGRARARTSRAPRHDRRGRGPRPRARRAAVRARAAAVAWTACRSSIDRTRIPLSLAPGLDGMDCRGRRCTRCWSSATGCDRRARASRSRRSPPTSAAPGCSGSSRAAAAALPAADRGRDRPADRAVRDGLPGRPLPVPGDARARRAERGGRSTHRGGRGRRRARPGGRRRRRRRRSRRPRRASVVVATGDTPDGPVRGARRAPRGGRPRHRRRSRRSSSTSTSGSNRTTGARCSDGCGGASWSRSAWPTSAWCGCRSTAISTTACAAFDRALEARGRARPRDPRPRHERAPRLQRAAVGPGGPDARGRAVARHDRGQRPVLGRRRGRADDAR